METKKVEKVMVAVHSLTTSLNKIHEAIGVKPDLVKNELKSQNIKPSGDQIWVYTGCDGKQDTSFKLDICIPVNENGTNTSNIHFNNLAEFSCVSYIHNGPWSDFGKVYERMFSEIGQKGQIPTGNFREIYINCDFEDPNKCITEIQVELQQKI